MSWPASILMPLPVANKSLGNSRDRDNGGGWVGLIGKRTSRERWPGRQTGHTGHNTHRAVETKNASEHYVKRTLRSGLDFSVLALGSCVEAGLNMIQSDGACCITEWLRVYKHRLVVACAQAGEESGQVRMHLELESWHLLTVDWKIVSGRKHSGRKTDHIINASMGNQCISDTQVSVIHSILAHTLAQ